LPAGSVHLNRQPIRFGDKDARPFLTSSSGKRLSGAEFAPTAGHDHAQDRGVGVKRARILRTFPT
jgi:hypothetical protein